MGWSDVGVSNVIGDKQRQRILDRYCDERAQKKASFQGRSVENTSAPKTEEIAQKTLGDTKE